ncbi:MAG: hypothetical protein ACK5QT_06260 [Oligoflexia bacterium]
MRFLPFSILSAAAIAAGAPALAQANRTAQEKSSASENVISQNGTYDDEVLPPGTRPVAPPPAIKKLPQPTRPRPTLREAEGTEAPNRFEAETVIKSYYQQNGQPLEVDPD